MRLLTCSTVFLVTLILGGCSSLNFIPSKRFPLCPAVAEKSYPEGVKLGVINFFLQKQADERGVKIIPLSEFAAEYYGSELDIQWFDDNYAQMLCAFDPHQEVFDRSTYISCMSHADEWKLIVRSPHPENLMLSETKFKENCSSTSLSLRNFPLK